MTETPGIPPVAPPAPPVPRELPAPVPELPYRAISFDLDGTLLALDQEDFLNRYFMQLEAYAVRIGVPYASLRDALNAGIHEMVAHKDGATNEDAFWRTFRQAIAALEPDSAVDWDAICEDFYNCEYKRVGDGIQPIPAVKRALDALDRKGYPLVLTTMPLFPRFGVDERLRWAGLEKWADLQKFRRMTTMENSRAAKPRLSYYAENLVAFGMGRHEDGGGTCLHDPSEILHVGNNTLEDGVFEDLGVDFFLVTDFLLNPNGADVGRFKHGTAEQFADWCEALPPCSDPLTDIWPGTVDNAQTAVLLAKLTGKSAAQVEASQEKDTEIAAAALHQ